MNSKVLYALGGSLLMVMTGMVRADATVSNADLKSEMHALKARIAELETRKSDQWLNERRAQEVKSLIRDVLADADTRASLMAEGMTAGHNGKNFFLASEDGSFLLKIAGQLQVRYIYNNRDEDSEDVNGDGSNDLASIDEEEFGFQIRRTKLTFSGNVASPNIFYKIQLTASRAGGGLSVEDAYAGYKFDNGITVITGSKKLPFLRQELISSRYQTAVDRASVTETFTLNRADGVWFNGNINDNIKWAVAMSDGGGANYTDFSTDRADFAITGRIDAKLMGDWGQAKDGAAWDGEETALFVGAAVHYEEGETGDGGANTSYFGWTVDALFESQGFSLLAAFMGGNPNDIAVVDPTTGAVTEEDFDNYGALVEAAYFVIPNKVQPFLRYEYIDIEDADSEVNILTFGGNYYLNKHNAKFTLDLVYAFDSLATGNVAQQGGYGRAAGNSTGLGLLPDNGDEDGQFAIRAQFQLLF